ncbi:MAG TPA: PKD domain-containing protein [Pyrinomonadaceae bacterium]|nr:PKD domain-containing protein [Pyrinomonadaceae bacterium]
MRYLRKWQLAAVCLLALASLPFVPAPRGTAQATGYTVTDLGALGTGNVSRAFGLNECGQVVGHSTLTSGNNSDTHPFLWSGGVMTDLGTLGGATGTALAVNRGGTVVGSALTSGSVPHAFIRPPGGPSKDLGTLGGFTVDAADINDLGQVVGQSENAGLQDRAFIWEDLNGDGDGVGDANEMRELTATWGTPIRAFGINNSGQVVGVANVNGLVEAHGYVTIGGQAVDLKTLNGGPVSFANKINDQGEVAGYSYTSASADSFHAFRWKDLNGNGQSEPASEMLDLGALGTGRNSFAYDINNGGQVVGKSETVSGSNATRAFVWSSANGMQDLNLLAPGTNWTFQEAQGINDRGQIVGVGLNPEGKVHGFLLTPSNPGPSPCDATPTPTPTPNNPPTANPGGPYAAQVGQTVQFTGSGSTDSDGTINSYSWDFGDGAVGTGVSPTHAYAAAGTYTVTLTVTDDDGATAQASTSATISPASPPTGLQYYPLAHPVRLLDTRAGAEACHTPGAKLAAGSVRKQAAVGSCAGLSIPATAKAIVGNATVVTPSANGWIILYPSGATQPTASNLNYVAGQVVPNAFTVALGADGAFNINTHAQTDFIVDVTGYYAPPGAGGLYYHPLPHPVRLLDTRAGYTACDAPGAPLAADSVRTETARTTCNGVTIPNDAKAIVGNATVVTPASQGWIILYPNGAAQPVVSNLNYVAGQVVPNAFNVGLGADGAFKIYSYASTDFIVDVTGYFSESAAPDANGVAGLLFYPLQSPARLLDTRSWATACHTPKAPLAADSVRTQPAQGSCAGSTIPASAQAIVGNATVTEPAAYGWIILYPTGAQQPVVSNLNYVAGQTVPNAFNVGLGAGGAFDIYTPTRTEFIIDMSGYFAP